MNIAIPHFDSSGIPEFEDDGPPRADKRWGWIGAVEREDVASCEVFLRSLEEGDIESAMQFQAFGGNILFAVARVSPDEVKVALFEKIVGPFDPALLENWTFKNVGVRVDSTEARQLEKLLQVTRLSWKDSFFAILRSFK